MWMIVFAKQFGGASFSGWHMQYGPKAMHTRDREMGEDPGR